MRITEIPQPRVVCPIDLAGRGPGQLSGGEIVTGSLIETID
jgi:hypothetical protein